MISPPVPSIDDRLDNTAAIVQLLLDAAHLDHGRALVGDAVRRRALAWQLLERDRTAAAAFGLSSPEPQLANAAWRALFDGGGPTRPAAGLGAQASALFEPVMRQGTSGRLPRVEISTAAGPRYLAILVAPQLAADGSVVGVIVCCVETTDDVLATLLDLPDEALVWTGDVAGAIARCGQSWCRFTGRSSEDSWIDAVHPDDRIACLAAWTKADLEPAELRVRLRRNDGVHRWHAVRVVHLDGESAAVGGATELADDRVEATSGGVEEKFLAAVSHELRAPLTTMMLWIGVLREGTADPELQRHALDAIHYSAQQQSRLVGDLVDIARASTGKLSIELRHLDMRRLIEDAVDAIAPSFAAKQVTVETRYAASTPAVEGDAARLRQVIDNLMSNALKFTPAGGRVIVTTSAPSHTLVIEICDTGRGIAPEFLPRLFLPFAQQDALLSRDEGGLGLGLAIAREIIALHHGTLEATSEGTGKGATFTITLASATRERASTPPPFRATGSLEGLRLLIVDDDHRVRSALGVLLTRAGASVRTAASAVEATEVLVDASFDAMICDIAMPGRDGNELMRGLRTDGFRTPAIALTAHVTPTDVQNVRAAGFDMHLAKPVDIERLITGIHVVITARA